VQSIERENIWKAREAQNDAIQWGVNVESSSSSKEGWPGVPAEARWHAPIGADGWPSVEGGFEVSIEVVSDTVELERERSACRLSMIIGCLSFSNLLSPLCHSTVGTSAGSCASPRSSCCKFD
jgi:hypothetical protein